MVGNIPISDGPANKRRQALPQGLPLALKAE